MKGKKYGRSLAVLSLVVALAMALTGCGGGDKPSGEPGEKPSETPSAGATTLKIGVAGPLTGSAAAYGQMVEKAVALAIEQANERQDVKDLGITFQIRQGDDVADETKAGNVANEFISDRNLIGLVGHVTSNAAVPAARIYAPTNVAAVSPSATTDGLTGLGLKNVFRTIGKDSVQGRAAGEFSYNVLGNRNGFAVDDSGDYGVGLAKNFSERFAELGGTMVGAEKVSKTETDYSSLITRIKAANPDVIYYGGFYEGGALFARQLRAAGVDTPLIGAEGLKTDEFIQISGDGAKNVYAVLLGVELADLAAGAQFVADYEARSGEAPGQFSPFAFDAANAIINAAVKVAQANGADSLLSAEGRVPFLDAIRASDFDGVTGKVSFDEFGDTKNTVVTNFTIEGGEWVVVK